MASLDENFTTAFANVPTSVNNNTEECTTLTLYVKPGGVITPIKPVNFKNQGGAIAHKNHKKTPKNTKSAYTQKALEFQGFCSSLYGTTQENQVVTDELFGFLYYKNHRGKYVTKHENGSKLN